jgi:hypothetical protein
MALVTGLRSFEFLRDIELFREMTFFLHWCRACLGLVGIAFHRVPFFHFDRTSGLEPVSGTKAGHGGTIPYRARRPGNVIRVVNADLASL